MQKQFPSLPKQSRNQNQLFQPSKNQQNKVPLLSDGAFLGYSQRLASFFVGCFYLSFSSMIFLAVEINIDVYFIYFFFNILQLSPE